MNDSAMLRTSQAGREGEFIIADQLIVNTDGRLLRMVLTSLLSSAWKFTGKRARPRIEFGCLSQGGVDWYFVRDNGAGFDMAYASKLFGAFQRFHSAGEFAGTGVGLAIVQRIINRHGGHIWAESKPDDGATFQFTLQPPPLGKAAKDRRAGIRSAKEDHARAS
jgi:light-regulated signal transduction histidine kinase (bacteriophytochrome)